MKILSNFEYKKLFLPNITNQILANNAEVQLYRIEAYLKDILIPVIPYRTTFNFIIFVTNGKMIQHLEGEEYPLEKGDIIFIKQGSITATIEILEDIEGFYLAYENTVLSKLNIPKYKSDIFFMNSYLHLDDLSQDTLFKLLPIMEQELWLSNLNANDVVVAMLHLVLQKLIQLDSGVKKKQVTRTMEISLQFRDLLFKHHIEEKRAGYYADQLLVTENYLNRCIKEVTQKTVKQWINEININYSKALLLSSKDIAEIAFELNFSTPSHFTQLFKKITGLTPKEYRHGLFAEKQLPIEPIR